MDTSELNEGENKPAESAGIKPSGITIMIILEEGDPRPLALLQVAGQARRKFPRGPKLNKKATTILWNAVIIFFK